MDTIDTLTTETKRTMRALHTWWDDESGVTAIEYGLLAALIFVACIVGVNSFSDGLGDVFEYWSNAVTTAINS